MKRAHLTLFSMVKDWELFLWDQEEGKDMHSSSLFNKGLKLLTRAIRQEKEITASQSEKLESYLLPYRTRSFVYKLYIPHRHKKPPATSNSNFSKLARYNSQRANQLHFYTQWTMWKENHITILLTIVLKMDEILRNNSPRRWNIYTENYLTISKRNPQ